MPSQTKTFGPNRRVPSRNKSKIVEKSWKEYLKTKANMRSFMNKGRYKANDTNKGNFGSPRDKQFSSKIGHPSNSVAKGTASKSNHVLKDMKQPIAPSFKNRRISFEKQQTLSRLSGKAKLEETHALKRKGEVNNASRPIYLKAMPGLVPKTTDILVQYSDKSSRSKKRASSGKDITSAKYSTTNLEFSKGIHMGSKGSCMTEAKGRQDEIVIDSDRENVKFGEHHKEGDTMKVKYTHDSTLSDIHCNSRGNHSMNLTFGNVEKRGLIERNMGQFANCNGKNSNSMAKKRKEPLPEENPMALSDNGNNVGVQVDNLSSKLMKKLKLSRVTRKDEAQDGASDLNHVGVEDDTTNILKNDHAKDLVSSCVEQKCYSCLKPIDKPSWSGIFKIDNKEYVSLDGHLSTKSCEKAWNLSRQLLNVVEVKKVSRTEVWPKAWELSPPIGDNIGIYFFPQEMKQDEGLDQLAREVMENDLALRAIVGEDEMLIFPSILLPIHHQTFQRKHYLWGVFKRRKDRSIVVEEPLNAMGRCEKEKQQKVLSDHPNHMLPVEEPNQEMIRIAGAISLERHMLPANNMTQEVEASCLKGPTNNKGFDLKARGEEGHAEGALVATDTASFPTSHGHIHSSMGHTPGRLMGFVVRIRKTPKLDRIIRDIEQEGALVFAMQGEMVGAGSWAGSKATASQK